MKCSHLGFKLHRLHRVWISFNNNCLNPTDRVSASLLFMALFHYHETTQLQFFFVKTVMNTGFHRGREFIVQLNNYSGQ